ncbi:MAG: hypothetical protein CEO22_79 [Candidatus Berkelbacteria bacterium Gr01-1014_85]|uniref:Uncharacterized protein n=1 Tax=Candidatus Berkelbacteria bacterium Gr01-1014_85 TaxID=2017150 RepID=A0A554JDW1_9BACT|nr:MAG: hypothetical protein CEO22_79 [Candidatus Berkelbacteria bacterium Gr01-1014_85]
MHDDELVDAVLEVFEGHRVTGQELGSAVWRDDKPSNEQKPVGQKRPDGYCTGGGWEGAPQIFIKGKTQKP